MNLEEGSLSPADFAGVIAGQAADLLLRLRCELSGGAGEGFQAAGIGHSVTVQCTIRLWRSWDLLSPRAFFAFPEASLSSRFLFFSATRSTPRLTSRQVNRQRRGP